MSFFTVLPLSISGNRRKNIQKIPLRQELHPYCNVKFYEIFLNCGLLRVQACTAPQHDRSINQEGIVGTRVQPCSESSKIQMMDLCPKDHLNSVGIQASFILKGKLGAGCRLLQTSGCWNSCSCCPCRCGHHVPIDKTIVILESAFSLSMNGSVSFKGQACQAGCATMHISGYRQGSFAEGHSRAASIEHRQ